MARHYRPGDTKWIGYPNRVARVEIVARGTGGHVFRGGVKPDNPYVVAEGEDEFVLSGDHLYDDPVQASIRSAELRRDHGLVLENPVEDDDFDEEDDEEFEDDEDEDEED